jgi:hypothetical protein
LNVETAGEEAAAVGCWLVITPEGSAEQGTPDGVGPGWLPVLKL